MNQNETIRINIDIDDRDLRNLNTVISDLQTTLNDLDSTLSTSISQVQNTVREVAPLETAFGTMNSTLDILQRTLSISTMSFQNIDNTIEFLTGTSNAFSNATSGARVAVDQKTTSMVLATGAATGLKWAMKAIPFVGVIALAGSLFSSFSRLIFNMEDATEETESYRHELDRLRSSMEGTASGAETSRDSFQANMKALKRSSDTVDYHIDTLDRLSRQTDLSNEERGKMIHSVAALNEHFEDLNLSIDEETGVLSESVGVLHERTRVSNTVTEAVEGQSYAIEHMNDLIDEEIQLNQELEQAEAIRDRITAAQQRYTEATQLASGATADQDELNKAIAESHEMLNELREEGILIGESEYEMFLDTATALEIVDDKVTELTNSQEENATNRIETAKEIAEAEEMIATATAESIDQQTLSYETLSDSQREVVDRMVGYWEKHAEMGSEMFRKLADDSEVCLGDIIANQDHNYEATKAWQDNLLIITARYGEEVAQHFHDMGESGMTTVAAMAEDVIGSYGEMETWTIDTLNTMADESGSQATQMVENLERGGELGGRGLSLDLGEGADEVLDIVENLARKAPETLSAGFAAADFPGIAQAIPDGAAEGLERVEKYLQNMRNLGEDGKDEYRDMMDINSPSGVFKGYGENIIQGLVKGIEALKSQPTTTLQKLATTMQKIYNSANRTYTTIGRDIMNGLNQGLLNGEGIVKATANRIANNIARTMRDALDINSPSRVMREQIGRQIPAGVAAGIDKYADYAIDSMHDLGNELTKINFPNINDIINTVPSLSLSGATIGGGTNNGYSVVNNNQGLFDGATINWSGEEDIRRTMEKIAWVTQRESSRMW